MSRKVHYVRNVGKTLPYSFVNGSRGRARFRATFEESSRKIWTTMKDYDTSGLLEKNDYVISERVGVAVVPVDSRWDSIVLLRIARNTKCRLIY